MSRRIRPGSSRWAVGATSKHRVPAAAIIAPPTVSQPPQARGAAPMEQSPAAAPQSQDLPAGWHRVVVRPVGGETLRGYTNDFQPGRGHLHLSPTINCRSAERLLVPVTRLKAVFFVKDLAGNPDYVDGVT